VQNSAPVKTFEKLKISEKLMNTKFIYFEIVKLISSYQRRENRGEKRESEGQKRTGKKGEKKREKGEERRNRTFALQAWNFSSNLFAIFPFLKLQNYGSAS
jgi:hypothetical protein